jgi:DNA-binding winged helix-turn-helix (wHTH) protein/tetratricopeptide (TPR) repeat protein
MCYASGAFAGIETQTMSATERQLLRFGDFQIQPASRCLTLNEQTVPLTSKAFDLLLYMARNPGRVLTKEELLSAVWPDSIVEEGNLTQSVFLLRKALAETKDKRYILTIPGRGYQFAAAVEAQVTPALLHASHTQTTAVIEEYFDGPSGRSPVANRRLVLWGVATLVLVGAVGAITYRVAHRPASNGYQTIVVADFVNRGNDPAFDLTLRNAVEIKLAQSPQLGVLSHSTVLKTLQLMGRQPSESLTEAVAQEVCARNNGQAVIAGEIVSVGSHFLMTLDALNCGTGTAITREKSEAATKEKVLSGLDHMTEQIRRQLGESPLSIKQFDVPLQQMTTKSFDALVAYSQAQASYKVGSLEKTLPLLTHAIELDPKFASAYAARSSILYNAGEFKRADEDAAKAYALSGEVSEKEKLRIALRYFWVAQGDLERAADTAKVWASLYPHDLRPRGELANLYIVMGRYPESVATALEASKLNPGSIDVQTALARAQKKANLYEEAKATCRNALAQGLDGWGLHSILFQIAYGQKDARSMATQVAWDKGKGSEDATLENEGYAAAAGGRIQLAREMFREAVEASRRQNKEDFPIEIFMDEEQVDLFAGFLPEARAEAEKIPPDQDVEVATQSGVAAALAGNASYAQRVIGILKGDPRHSVLRDKVDLPLVEAALAVYQHKAPEAVKLMEPAQVYELKDYIIPFVRGRAFLDAGLPERAVIEYRAITENPGIDPVSPMYPLGFLGLARAYSMQGKRSESRAAYERFLDLWKDADANVPVLQQARQEYAALTSN